MFFETSLETENALVRIAAPFQIANTYGLFASMTTTRPEIIVQGSNDGQTWLDYEFRYKPGDLRAAAALGAPYQPRLDWQMWFAALSGLSRLALVHEFHGASAAGLAGCCGIARGKIRFPTRRPKYVRAELFDYSFTNFATRRATGDWWTRQPRGLYFPEISLEDVRPRQ